MADSLCSSLIFANGEEKRTKREIGQEVLDAVHEIKKGGGKRVTIDESPLSLVAKSPDNDALSLDEINEIVPKVRRQRH